MTYREYHEKYDIRRTLNNPTRRNTYLDNLNNHVIERNISIITRIRYLTIEHGELYFYQQLLLTIPCRSENELKGNYDTYRDHFMERFSERFAELMQQNRRAQHLQTVNIMEQFNNLIEELLLSLQTILIQDIRKIIQTQVKSIKIMPPILPLNIMTGLPTSQYYCMQTIKNYMGPRDSQHYPYFFITGPMQFFIVCIQ